MSEMVVGVSDNGTQRRQRCIEERLYTQTRTAIFLSPATELSVPIADRMCRPVQTEMQTCVTNANHAGPLLNNSVQDTLYTKQRGQPRRVIRS
jgi:hypothetical protein